MTLVALILSVSTLAMTNAQSVRPDPQVLEDQARKLNSEGKFLEAKEVGQQSLALREAVAGPTDRSLVTILRVLGIARFRTDDFHGAAADFKRAAAILRASTDPADQKVLAAVLNTQGQAHLREGRWREADAALTEALAALQKTDAGPAALAGVYNTLGGFLLTVGDYERAGVQFKRAVELWSGVLPADDPRLGNALSNMGMVAQSAGHYDEAKQLYGKALAILEKGEDAQSLGLALNNIGSTLHEEGHPSAAQPMYERAIALYEKAGPSAAADLGQALTNLAVAFFAQGRHDQAAVTFRKALDLRERTLGPHHGDVAATLTAQAIFLQATGHAADALQAQSRATDIIEENLELLLDVGSESQKERALRLFAENVDIALWMRSVSHDDSAANETALLTVLRRKGRLQEVLASSSEALRSRSGGRGTPQLDEYAALRASLAGEILAGVSTPAEQARVAAIEERIDALEAALGRQGPGRRAGASVTLEGVRRAIPATAVLIEVFRYRPFDPLVFRAEGRFGAPRYVAYALAADRAPVWIELGDAAAIDEASASFRSALLNPRRADVVARGQALRPLLTTAFERLADGARKVYLAPDGELNLLPFQALVSEQGDYLIDRYDITYLTGGRDLVAPPSTTPSGPSLVVGNPAFGAAGKAAGPISRSFKTLPGADREAHSVAALIPGSILLRGAGATEGAIKSAAGPRLLHIATHGFFLQASGPDAVAGTRGLRQVADDETATLPALLRSGLAFAGANRKPRRGDEDGILTASEAALLNLHGTELVFLSACESGLGVVSAGESVYGLRRAFAIAGARSQVLTLWQVSDLATRQFVEDFYRALAGGARRDEAMRAAQRAARADPARRHPFYWAPFILSGSDAAIGPLRPLVQGK